MERVLHRSPDGAFAVVRIAPESGPVFVAAGRLPADAGEGDFIELLGEFEIHAKFGSRFKVKAAWLKPPDSLEGVRRYLRSGRIAGVGRKLADRLLAHFGADTLRILEEQPERLREVPGVGRKREAQLRAAFTDGRAERETLVFLHGLGLGPAMAQAVFAHFGPEAQARVRNDPYCLADAIDGIGFSTADRVAKEMGVAPDSPARLRAGLAHGLREAMDQGHLALPSPELLHAATALLKVERELVLRAIQAAVDSGEFLCLQRGADEEGASPPPLVQLPVLHRAEREAVRRIRAIQQAGGARLPPFRSKGSAPDGILLSEEQERALLLLSEAKVAILTGGPGVGKTTVLRAFVEHAKRSGLSVALASPTGRAARRLHESTGEDASTLHRLFGLAPNLAARKQPKSLEADILIIDETSMVDLPLFVQVLRRIPDSTRIILVGDPDQLESVGPGSVLKDLIASNTVPTARLVEVFRQAAESDIVRNAHRVLAGCVPEFRERGTSTDAFFIEPRDPGAADALIQHLATERIPARFGLDPQTDIQVLAPMHRGRTGVEHLNALIQKALNGHRPSLQTGARVFHEGDRVIQKRNDYDRDVMNGDLGTVLAVFPDAGRIAIQFEGRDPHTYSGREIDDVDPAFALTIHKSQGAEFPAVILSLFPEHRLMLRRSLLYTAITRAKRLLVVVGARPALRHAVANAETQFRHGLFADLLAGRLPAPAPPFQLPAELHKEGSP